MERSDAKGFTLVELLVGVAIAGILLAVAVPSFFHVMKESQISTQYNALVGAMYLARSEAIKGPGDVTVCPRSTIGANTCGDAKDWANGWLVFMDRTIVQGETQATIDSTDEILSMAPSIESDNTIVAIGSPTQSAADANEVGFVRYTRSGGASWITGSMVICDAYRGPIHSRAINIVLTGDIRRGRAADPDTPPRDVFNRAISQYCPEVV